MTARSRFRLLAPPASLAGFLVLIAATPAFASGKLKVETGRLQDFISTLASNEYLLGDSANDHRPYVEPGPAVHALRHIAQQVAAGDVNKAAEQAAQVGCEVVKFTDNRTHEVYFAIREDRTKVAAIRGWGSYIYKPSGSVDALVEIPHPIADANTRGIGAAVFVASDAKGFLLAGAHRDKADVPDLVDSVFHQVHMAWVGPFGKLAAWQIHGFALGKHGFPVGASVIASSGDGAVVPEISHLDAMAETHGLSSYVFNDLSPQSKDNQKLNGGLPGMTFNSLAATKNEQGRYSRSVGGAFVHVELETSVRMEQANRELAAGVIADAVRRTSTAQLASDEPETVLASFVSDTDADRRDSDSPEVRLARRSESSAASGRKVALRRTLSTVER